MCLGEHLLRYVQLFSFSKCTDEVPNIVIKSFLIQAWSVHLLYSNTCPEGLPDKDSLLFLLRRSCCAEPDDSDRSPIERNIAKYISLLQNDF